MNKPAAEDPELTRLQSDARIVFSTQLVLLAVSMWLFYFYQGENAAKAAFFGGFIVLFNQWMTHWRLRRAIIVARHSPGKEVSLLYLAAMQRFVFTLLFFIVGFAWLQLMPIPLLISFAVGQTGYFVSGLLIGKI